MEPRFDAVYYEPDTLSYDLGRMLKQKYAQLPWEEIQSHNSIPAFRASQNKDFTRLKQHLVIGVRKTHK